MLPTRSTRFPFATNTALLVSCIFLLVHAGATAAETDRISTDRPDYVDSSNVVGYGRLQIETSVSQERNGRSGIKTRNIATPTLVRYGAFKNFELRIETDGRLTNRIEDTNSGQRKTAHGVADTSVGVKWHAADAVGYSPSVGVIIHADLDTGSPNFRGNGVRPSLRLPAEWDLPMNFSVGIMPGLAFASTDTGTRFASASFGVVIGKAWTDNLRTFIEVSASQIARARNGGSQLSFDTGVGYLLSDNCQLDTAFSRGLNKNTPDTSWTVGFSFRL